MSKPYLKVIIGGNRAGKTTRAHQWADARPEIFYHQITVAHARSHLWAGHNVILELVPIVSEMDDLLQLIQEHGQADIEWIHLKDNPRFKDGEVVDPLN